VAFGNSFNDEERCVAAGYDNGDIKLLDLRMNRLRWEINIGDGVVGLEFDRKDIPMNKLVATTLESRFMLYDMRTQHPDEGFASLSQKAHNSTIWLTRHLPQNRELFMTCAGDGTTNLYKYHYPAQRKIVDDTGNEKGVIGSVELLNTKKFSDLPVVSFDWSPDKQGLFVMSAGTKLLSAFTSVYELLMCSLILTFFVKRCFAVDQNVKVGIVTKLAKY
jgi:WD40 repeat protein